MLTTRVIPTSGHAFVAGIDVVAHPVLVKQLIGTVSQTNTLDRQLNVWENLYFHGRLFGIGPAESRRTADELLERLQLSKFAKASVYALSGGMAQRLMVARFHIPQAGGPLHGRADRGTRPSGQAGALGHLARAQRGRTDDPSHHALHGRSRPALSTGWRSWTTGRSSLSTPPAGLKKSVGADTIVTIKAAGDLEAPRRARSSATSKA